MSLSLCLVVPAYNEEVRLGASLQRLVAYLSDSPWDWSIRVIDDGSSDGTVAVVEEFSRQHTRVLVQREPHRGKGGAVRAGMLQATEDYRFICDADLSMPPEELPRFLDAPDYDISIGSREGKGARRVGEPWMRHIMGRVFNGVVQSLVVQGIRDTQCGFKMFTAQAAEQVFARQTVDGWAFDVEILAIAQLHGLRIREVPIEWHYADRSQVSPLGDSVRMFREVVEIRKKARKGLYTRPLLGGDSD